MPDIFERTMFDKAIEESNSSRIQALVARFEKAIQTHDARLGGGAAERISCDADDGVGGGVLGSGQWRCPHIMMDAMWSRR